MQVKVIFAVVKQLKQLQRKPRKKSEAPMGFKPMTSVIPVRCCTNWATVYEALLEAGQEGVQFIPVIWREWDDVQCV